MDDFLITFSLMYEHLLYLGWLPFYVTDADWADEKSRQKWRLFRAKVMVGDVVWLALNFA